VEWFKPFDKFPNYEPLTYPYTIQKPGEWVEGHIKVDDHGVIQPVLGQPNWYHGLTIRGPMDMHKMGAFLQVRAKTWLSLEPLWGPVVFGNHELDKEWDVIDSKEDTPAGMENEENAPKVRKWHRAYLILGVIVGHDNTWTAPGTKTLRHIRSVVRQCQWTKTPCFVKQIYMGVCDQCSAVSELSEDPEDTWECPACSGEPHRTGRLKPRLITDPELFPEDLRARVLPWSMPKGIE
jgi:hypothetical protein